MSAQGLLRAIMQPLADFEAKYNAWYGTEHLLGVWRLRVLKRGGGLFA